MQRSYSGIETPSTLGKPAAPSLPELPRSRGNPLAASLRLRACRGAAMDSATATRGSEITTYLENGGTLENAKVMAAHASVRTTQLYNTTVVVMT
jgi:hypothetical protein